MSNLNSFISDFVLSGFALIGLLFSLYFTFLLVDNTLQYGWDIDSNFFFGISLASLSAMVVSLFVRRILKRNGKTLDLSVTTQDGLESATNDLHKYLGKLRGRARVLRSLSVFVLALGLSTLLFGFFIFVNPSTITATSTGDVAAEIRNDLRSQRNFLRSASLSITKRSAAEAKAFRDLLDDALEKGLTEPLVKLHSAEDKDSPEHFEAITSQLDGQLNHPDCSELEKRISIFNGAGDNDGKSNALNQRTTVVVEAIKCALQSDEAAPIISQFLRDREDLSADVAEPRELSDEGEALQKVIDTASQEIEANSQPDGQEAYDAAWATQMLTRIGSLVFVFFTVRFLSQRYIFLSEEASKLEELADGVELVNLSFDGRTRDLEIKTFLKELRSHRVQDKPVPTGLEQLPEVLKSLADTLAKLSPTVGPTSKP